MEENFEFSFCNSNLNENDLNQKKAENENNKKEDPRNIITHMNTYNTPVFGINNYKNESKKDYNNSLYNNDKHTNVYNLYSTEFFQNEPTNKNNNRLLVLNETLGNEGELIQVNSDNYIEQNDYKKTLHTSNKTVNVNGKQITTKNEAISDALNDMFHKTEINIDTIKDMQLTKKKKKRRKKKEVEKEKLIKSKEIKIKLKLGRKPKNEIGENFSAHSKNSDDNIIKKINSYFLERVRNWLNNSFVDENGNFEKYKDRQKFKKSLFLKIDPKKITTNLKRKDVINFMDDSFRNIFSNNISKKYTNANKDNNQKLINKLYNDNNQPFVLYILESKFIDILNYFNGENKGDNIKQYFLEKNINEQKINEFLSNFDKIENFLTKIKLKMEKETIEKIKDYIDRIVVLCLNYKTCFEKKYNRSENKNKKEIKKENDINN